MKHASLFSGIGGFDLAAEWMGWENIFHCEWMEFPRKVLDYYWPNADSHTDICKTDFKKYANQIDILTGGFPCQPFSMAGKRKGTEDERYLWGEMLRAVQEIKPKYVIAENVFGITNIDGGLVFEQVCLDLEAEGYEVQPFVIPAAAKNAPHRRDRVWFVAYSNIEQRERKEGRFQSEFINGSKDTTDTNGIRYRGGHIKPRTNKFKEWEMDKNLEQHRNGVWCKIKGCSWNATNADSNGLNQRNSNDENNTSKARQYALSYAKQISIDTKRIGRVKIGNDNGQFEKTQQAERRKQQFGRTDSTQDRWRNFPTQSPICGGDDGIPTKLDGITFSKWRAESIKGYGNAIVPQVALEIFKVIQNIDCNLSK